MPEAIPAAKPRNLFCSDLSVSSGLAAAWLSVGIGCQYRLSWQDALDLPFDISGGVLVDK